MMSKKITDVNEQVEMLIIGMKKIVIGSPMDYEEIAKECLEQVGVNTKDPKNFRV
jgi:hypothetical protein